MCSTSSEATSSDEHAISERLTLKSLTQWAEDSRQHMMTVRALPKIFAMLSKSDFLMENFLQFPYNSQNSIIANMSFDADVDTVAAIYALRKKLEVKRNDGIEWLQLNNDDLNKTVYNFSSSPSTVFTDELRYFKMMYQNRKARMYGWDWFLEDAVLLLFALYGESVVLQVMEAWNDKRPSDKVHVFIQYVERYEEFTDYPFEWAWNLMEVDQSGK